MKLSPPCLTYRAEQHCRECHSGCIRPFTPCVAVPARNPWYATDEEVDKLRQEYLTEKYK